MGHVMIDIMIPVYKPDERFFELLDMLGKQTVKINQIILMNTEQKYWDEWIYHHPKYKLPDNVKVWHISKWEFDHGRTRRDAVKKSKAEIFVMMTMDAMPKDEFLLENLIKSLEKETVAVSYARQLPRQEAGPVEKFTRYFNYPETSRIKTKEDIPELGIKTYFCSNVCAAYKRSVYDEIGGFIKNAIFNEDMVYAAACAERGYGIAYAASAQVIHSHHYTNKEQFHRNFDVGVSQAEHPEVFDSVPSESEGIRLVKQTAAYLKKEGYSKLIIPMCITSAYKLIGYKLGKNYKKLSPKKVLKYTMNKEYFRKKGY